jgi:hypothetical protein
MANYYATIQEDARLLISRNEIESYDLILDNRDLQNLHRSGVDGIVSLPLLNDTTIELTIAAKNYLIMYAKFNKKHKNLLCVF